MLARTTLRALRPIALFLVVPNVDGAPAKAVRLSKDVTLPAISGLRLHKVETEAATYFLETSGAGLAVLLGRDGNDWIGFRPEGGTREYDQ